LLVCSHPAMFSSAFRRPPESSLFPYTPLFRSIGRVGDLLGRETRRRAAHVLLAPAVNLHRTPVGGRTFEYFSEDPELSAALAVADRKSTRLNSSHVKISYAVFCLKKKNNRDFV